MSKIIIIGGGAAGMMAAIAAARNHHNVILIEKNKKLGKKLYITGKGRCNITNACDIQILFQQIQKNNKFLYSALYGFSNEDCIQFFEQIGLKTKIERGDRVFPVSDKSSDVIFALQNELKKCLVEIRFEQEVEHVIIENGQFYGVKIKGRDAIEKANSVIIATGGLSYQTTGSTGDGYRFAEQMGHKITELSPSLVPFNIREDYIKELQGLSLKNIQVTVTVGKKPVYQGFGEMLFTHFGVSGPLILSASSQLSPYSFTEDPILSIDLKPALTVEQLDNRLMREFAEGSNKSFKNILDRLLPKKLIPVMIHLSEIDPEKKVHSITKEERVHLISLIKGFSCHIAGLRGYKEAVITRGGIDVKEINPSTMESKKVKNVYFAGEVLDLDGLTGGFNLQIAWSTAYLAGSQCS